MYVLQGRSEYWSHALALSGASLPSADGSSWILEPLGSGPNQTNSTPWLEQLRWGLLAVGSPLPEPAPVMARLELDGPL